MMKSLTTSTALCIALLSASGALATPITLTFDEYPNGAVLTTQYQGVGVTVSGANVLDSNLGPWPANSAPNYVFAPTGLMTFTLDSLITGNIQTVSAYVWGATSVGIYAYDAANILLEQALTPGATDNLLLSLTSLGNPIASIQIHDGGSSFAIDTLEFATLADAAAVPAPETVWLMMPGLLGLMGMARRKAT